MKKLCEPFYRSHRVVTFDNFFTNYELANILKQNGLFCVGTLRKNKPFIPKEFLPNRTREVGSNLFGYRANMTLVSYTQKVNHAVLLLSTYHHAPEVDPESGKSEINLFYNKTKGGVDTLDQLCHAYTVQRRTNRWPFAFFMNLINVAGVAANVIYKTTFQVQSSTKFSQRKKFLHDLTEQLVHEQIKRRSRIGLYRLDQLNLDNIVGPSTDEPGPSGEPPAKAARRRCYICPSNQDRKVKQCCEKCKKNVCNDHAVTSIICSRCRAYMNTSDSL